MGKQLQPETNDVRSQANSTPPHRSSGSRNHWLTFALSIALTAIAFIAVGMQSLNRDAVVGLILVLALVQSLFQLYVWMHMDQKGHRYPAIGIYGGLFVAIITVMAFVYIMWW